MFGDESPICSWIRSSNWLSFIKNSCASVNEGSIDYINLECLISNFLTNIRMTNYLFPLVSSNDSKYYLPTQPNHPVNKLHACPHTNITCSPPNISSIGSIDIFHTILQRNCIGLVSDHSFGISSCSTCIQNIKWVYLLHKLKGNTIGTKFNTSLRSRCCHGIIPFNISSRN